MKTADLTIVNKSLLSCTGPPKADWTAPARAKWQATPTRTPARAPKKPHPMATAAVKRAQIKELEAAPRTYLANQDMLGKASTPAKRMLCSSALSAQHTPVKRVTPMHAPDSRGRQWQQDMMHEGDGGVEGAFHQDFCSMGTELSLQGLDASRLRAGAVPYDIGVHQQSVSSTAPRNPMTGSLGTFRTPLQVLTAARPQAQRYPVRREVGLKSGSTGGSASLQLRTPLRPNSAGSALRGYVPPEHRFVSAKTTCQHCSVVLNFQCA